MKIHKINNKMENDSDEYINELISKNLQYKKKSKRRYFFEKIKNTLYDNTLYDNTLHDHTHDNTLHEIEKIKSNENDNIVINNIIKENLNKNNIKKSHLKSHSKFPTKKFPINDSVVMSYDSVQNLRSALVDFNMDISINITTHQIINDSVVFIRNLVQSGLITIDEEWYFELKNLINQILCKIIDKIYLNKIFNSLITNMKYTIRDILLNLLEK